MLKEIEINIRILHWRSLQSSKDSNIKGFDSFFNILKISLSDSACHFIWSRRSYFFIIFQSKC